MLLSANGWGRDHGIKEIIEDDLMQAPVDKTGYSKEQAYIRVVRSVAGCSVVVEKITSIKLNGEYLVHVELSQREIARLFYLTHNDKNLRDIAGVFGEFKQEEDNAVKDAAKAEADRLAAEAAKSPKRRSLK